MSQPPKSIARGRQRLFAAIAIVFGCGLGLAILEFGLGQLRQRIETSDHLQPGLTRYDARLGWRLNPGWQGRHVNRDFEASYSINAGGTRGAAVEPAAAAAPAPAPAAALVVYLGDSFTFGFGVPDGATFADRLDRADRPNVRHLNFGVPGYSTDQALLLYRSDVAGLRPRRVVLIAYLGNDLIDNEQPFPLQARTGKPHFALEGGELTLRNVPVPLRFKSPDEQRRSFGSLIAGPELGEAGRLARWLYNLETVRWLGLEWPPPADLEARYGQRFATSMVLFDALTRQLQREVEGNGGQFALVVLASRRHALAPETYAARYQEFARRSIVTAFVGSDLVLIDAATALRAAPASERLFFPHDGHLSEAGHQFLADLLASRLGQPTGRAR